MLHVALAVMMALANNNSTNALYYRTTNLPNENDISGTFWVQYDTNLGAAIQMAQLLGASSGTTIIRIFIDATAHLSVAASGVTAGTGSVLSMGTWYFVGWRHTGTTYETYLNGSTTADATATGSETANAIANFSYTEQGIAPATTNLCDCNIAAAKTWNAYLTPEQLRNEMYHYRPMLTQNLQTWYPLVGSNNVTTVIGLDLFNAFNLTVSSGGSDFGPPISW